MKRKLDFKDIAGYLPYYLKVLIKRNFDIIGTAIGETNGYMRIFGEDAEDYFEESEDFIKPILLPLSDLYRTIIHNGKEIVPIVELARICYSHIQNIEIRNGLGGKFCFVDRRLANHQFGFYFEEKTNSFRSVYLANYTDDIVINQYKLFDYLHELKIDYRGLIDAGLAIDVNTLETNTYKLFNHETN